MDCPICKTAMITFELEDVEVDYCLDCRGIWLDAGELEMLLGAGEGSEEITGSFHEAINCSEKPRKCPICLKKMRKILVGEGDGARLIDKCGKGDGLWFDEGELTEIMELGSFDKGNRVKHILGEMFGGNADS